jgi:hypothetical protein
MMNDRPLPRPMTNDAAAKRMTSNDAPGRMMALTRPVLPISAVRIDHDVAG